MQERRALTPLIRARLSPGRLVLLLAVAALVTTADQISKSMVQRRLAPGPVHVIGPLNLELSYNTGAAFGLGRGLSPVIVVVVVICVLAVLSYTTVLHTTTATVGAGLVLGGAVSNLADRLFRSDGGAVIDWIHLSYWPTFNVADSCVVLGVGLLLLGSLLSGPPART